MFNINICKQKKIWHLQPTTATVITRVLCVCVYENVMAKATYRKNILDM